jgi:hypothetical protein
MSSHFFLSGAAFSVTSVVSSVIGAGFVGAGFVEALEAAVPTTTTGGTYFVNCRFYGQ